MKQKLVETQTPQQQLNMQYSEDRIQLLDTIQEMIDVELDRRSSASEQIPPHENLLSESPGGELSAVQPRLSFWQRIVHFFMA